MKQGKEWSLNDARHDKEVTTLDTEITQTTIDLVAAKITFSLVKLHTVNHIEMKLKMSRLTIHQILERVSHKIRKLRLKL